MRGLSSMLEAYERGRLLAMMERDIAGVTGVRSEFLGEQAPQGRGERLNFNQPAQPNNCVNCGAPRARASSACCDYCGS